MVVDVERGEIVRVTSFVVLVFVLVLVFVFMLVVDGVGFGVVDKFVGSVGVVEALILAGEDIEEGKEPKVGGEIVGGEDDDSIVVDVLFEFTMEIGFDCVGIVFAFELELLFDVFSDLCSFVFVLVDLSKEPNKEVLLGGGEEEIGEEGSPEEEGGEEESIEFGVFVIEFGDGVAFTSTGAVDVNVVVVVVTVELVFAFLSVSIPDLTLSRPFFCFESLFVRFVAEVCFVGELGGKTGGSKLDLSSFLSAAVVVVEFFDTPFESS